jgi:hypothetical protein
MLEKRGIRHIRRCIDQLVLSSVHQRFELNGRHSCDHGHVKFPLQALLDDLHVKHAQESATETKTQSGRSLRFPNQGCIVELEFSMEALNSSNS